MLQLLTPSGKYNLFSVGFNQFRDLKRVKENTNIYKADWTRPNEITG
jgi:hypothetical protein